MWMVLLVKSFIMCSICQFQVTQCLYFANIVFDGGRIQNMCTGPWTIPVDLVHGPTDRPSPWTTQWTQSMGHLIDHNTPNFQKQILPVSVNRELKQTTTATATRTSPNKRFNEQNNSSARAFEVLVHFLAVLCKTTT